MPRTPATLLAQRAQERHAALMRRVLINGIQHGDSSDCVAGIGRSIEGLGGVGVSNMDESSYAARSIATAAFARQRLSTAVPTPPMAFTSTFTSLEKPAVSPRTKQLLCSRIVPHGRMGLQKVVRGGAMLACQAPVKSRAATAVGSRLL